MSVFDDAKAALDRQYEKGRRKYPVTLDEAGLSAPELLDHAIEEAADMLVYLCALRASVRR